MKVSRDQQRAMDIARSDWERSLKGKYDLPRGSTSRSSRKSSLGWLGALLVVYIVNPLLEVEWKFWKKSE